MTMCQALNVHSSTFYCHNQDCPFEYINYSILFGTSEIHHTSHFHHNHYITVITWITWTIITVSNIIRKCPAYNLIWSILVVWLYQYVFCSFVCFLSIISHLFDFSLLWIYVFYLAIFEEEEKSELTRVSRKISWKKKLKTRESTWNGHAKRSTSHSTAVN